jgi:metal-sulfur cluster biosynthetic enzyme
VIDPELGINIVDLRLIYSLEIDKQGMVRVIMSMTTPGYPIHASFRTEIEATLWRPIAQLEGVTIDVV